MKNDSSVAMIKFIVTIEKIRANSAINIAERAIHRSDDHLFSALVLALLLRIYLPDIIAIKNPTSLKEMGS